MIVRLATTADLDAVYGLRHEVFVLGQDVPAELERDELDAVSDHAVALIDDVVLGTGRLLPDGTIGRMAVASAARGLGLGAAVLARLEERARERGLPRVELHAQLQATGFYDRAGYVAFGEIYLEAGIEHRSMRKELSMNNADVVNAFLVAAAARDYDTALALVTDDVEYQNMMMPATIGKAAVRETCEALLALCTSSEWVVHKQVAQGDLVMNERTDRFEMGGVWTDLPVAGVFELRAGLISSWHDYFDLSTVMAAMPSG